MVFLVVTGILFITAVQRILESWNMGSGSLLLGPFILYPEGTRIRMFQLYGFDSGVSYFPSSIS